MDKIIMAIGSSSSQKADLDNTKSQVIKMALIYRIYYKVMNTTISPRAIRMSPPGHIVIMEADKTKHKTFIPKRLAWDEIIKQTDWKLEKLCPPKPLHDQNESETQQIIQEFDHFTPN